MTSSESEEQPRIRKRSRTSANGDEAGSKKARGRPRVDTQDATAADVSSSPENSRMRSLGDDPCHVMYYNRSVYSESVDGRLVVRSFVSMLTTSAASSNTDPSRPAGLSATERNNHIVAQEAK